MKRTELRNLIKALGGPGVVGRQLTPPVDHSAVSKWKAIPLKHCPTIERLARDKRITRSDGTPYTCEVFAPQVEWAAVRDKPVSSIVVHAE